MCTGIPARVLRVSGSEATVDVGDGRRRSASVGAPEPVRRGDFVLLYADVVVSKIDRRSALESVREMKEIAVRAAEEEGRNPAEASLPFEARLRGLSAK